MRRAATDEMHQRGTRIATLRFAPYVFVLLVLTGAGTFEYQEVPMRQVEDTGVPELNRLTFDPSDSGPNLAAHNPVVNHTASAPEMISINSLVIIAWRVRL